MFNTPIIDALDLRSNHGRFLGAMRTMTQNMAAFVEAFTALESWIDWEEISWSWGRQHEVDYRTDAISISLDSRVPARRLVGRLLDVLNFRRSRSLTWKNPQGQPITRTVYTGRAYSGPSWQARSHEATTGGRVVGLDHRPEAPKLGGDWWLDWLDKPLDFNSYVQGMLVGSALTASVISLVEMVWG